MAGGSVDATSHFLLKPEKLRFSHLIRILLSSGLGDFVVGEGLVEGFDEYRSLRGWLMRIFSFFVQRWLIFITILVQGLLLLVAKPLAGLGYIVEQWPEAKDLSISRKLFMSIYNCIRGKKIEPEVKVMKLPNSIKPEHSNYNAALCIMACDASYKKIDYIKSAVSQNPEMEFVDSYGFGEEKGKTTTDAYILLDKRKNTYILVFRGTEPFNAHEWCTDFDISWYKFHDHRGKIQGKIHGGFIKALGLQKDGCWPDKNTEKKFAYFAIRDILKKAFGQNDKARLMITGHSLGGALAILFAGILFMHNETDLLERLDEVYTFGQPRVGDAIFARYMRDKLRDNDITYCRVVYSNDMVPRLPFDVNKYLFKHIGPCIHYNWRYLHYNWRNWCYIHYNWCYWRYIHSSWHYDYEIVKQLPNENYFSLRMAIPKRVIALFELIRSLVGGPKNVLEVVSKVGGLAFPGVPTHFSQAYVDATSSGFPPVHDLTIPN